MPSQPVHFNQSSPFRFLAILAALALFATACSRARTTPQNSVLALPAVQPLELSGRPLSVVATTGIIGDVVARIGGSAIDLVVLMGPGVDPHSFVPAPRDLAALEDADVVFVNGWNLEESLLRDIASIATGKLVVPISAGIQPLEAGDPADGSPESGQADPHVWLAVANVDIWSQNVESILSGLDPNNASGYRQNAVRFRLDLADLEAYAQSRFDAIPEGKKLLVTNHDSLSYLAQAYGFEIFGTVLPTASTLAEPTAADLADLVKAMDEAGICTIFTDTSANDTLARTVAAELSACPQVAVVALYTGNLGPAGSGADSYAGMFRYDVDAIANGLE